MKQLAVAVALALSILFPASAATMRAQDMNGTSVTVDTVKACTSSKAKSQLPKLQKMLRDANKKLGADAYAVPKAKDLHAGYMVFKGKTYQVCWVALGDQVIVLDDGGQKNSIFPVPASEFAPAVDM